MATRTLPTSTKVPLRRPLDRDWITVRPQMDGLAWMAHRVLNGTMKMMAISEELPQSVPPSWCSKVNESSSTRSGGKVSSYQMVKQAIARANQERTNARPCSWCDQTGKEPSSAPTDKKGKIRKLNKKELKKERKPGDVCSRCDGVGQITTGIAIDVPVHIQMGWSRLIDRRWATDKSDVWKGVKSISSFKAPAPIMVTSSGTAFIVRKHEKNYIVEIPLYAGGKGGLVPFVLGPDGPNAHMHLRRMLDDPSVKLGDLKLLAPKGEGKKKWLVVISYSWDQHLPDAGTQPNAVIRQNVDGSPELCIEGRHPKRLYEGKTLRHKRHVFSLQRAGRSKHQRDIGHGARGHGRNRTFEHYHSVDDREQRWVHSMCQEIAAKAAREAKLRGSRWVIIDESFKILPPASLRGALEWALTKAGFVKPGDKSLPAGASNQSSSKEES